MCDTISLKETKIFKDYDLNNSQIRSLADIKAAVSKIWQGDRNIKCYTDHGITHCQNIFNYLERLLPLAHNKLETDEAFSLFAAVYLHDIGMQCDDLKIFKYLRLNITNNERGKYNTMEQKIMRKNHNKISAAWLYKAICGKCPDLGPIIRDFTPALHDAIYHIVLYHAGEDYQKCTGRSKIEPDIRLKLLVTLLRLADELDIGYDRIDIEEVRRQNINLEENGYVWWLHYLTNPHIKIVEGNGIIELITYANKEDLDTVREPLNYLVEENFKKKNESLIKYLFHNGFPIRYEPKEAYVAKVKTIPEDVKNILVKKYLKSHLSEVKHDYKRFLKEGKVDQLNNSLRGMEYLNFFFDLPYHLPNPSSTNKEIIKFLNKYKQLYTDNELIEILSRYIQLQIDIYQICKKNDIFPPNFPNLDTIVKIMRGKNDQKK